MGPVSAAGPRESRRYDFPPLWAVPLMLIAGISLIVCLSMVITPLALIPALVGIAWLERKADAFVRSRQARL